MARFDLRNKGQSGVPFYTPAQEPAAGTAADASTAPTLYKPLRVRSLELHNRFAVSPMCQYSADDGHLTDYHLVHLGQFALNGAGVVMVEATATEPRGRISPQDSGLWQDSQIEPLRRIVNYVHSQNTKAGIQIAHAGRKASTLAPWIGGSANKALAAEEHGGWPDQVVGPSAIPFAEDHATPTELSVDDIRGLVKSFGETALRAVKAGFDLIEIHGAHGYLITEFLSPISNKRTDSYGGSFENRTRFLREVIETVRSVIPESMPLWLRVSATEWMEWTGEPSWDLDSTIRLAKLLPALGIDVLDLLPALGIDVLDVSSGGNNSQQRLPREKTYQTSLAREIRRALRADKLDLIVGAVGNIDSAEFARDVVQEGDEQSADLALVARHFLREPDFVLNAAEKLGVPVKWPNQYHRAAPKEVSDAF
ncbi:NADH-dependent flavin oxidoreductase-like protein [Metarhizium acridum CQMa 102]|uniref:NADH-dependent flavin oxidoreductase-like protein n=1 Tax=Metarhizium acridum (strain CQMa 102) TaxID=655827 RepID=E9DSE7_METAQ|nr:NADH-dependent flavin oxidoreductase-like protein [Metarhizium acridum CQMa 102]EFY93307.1 NADH-dependent flavin oxidoreductase-like protein [Metarhizium acridum CQMa 102]